MSTGFAYGNWIMATDPLVLLVLLLCCAMLKGGVRGRCTQQVADEGRGGRGKGQTME